MLALGGLVWIGAGWPGCPAHEVRARPGRLLLIMIAVAGLAVVALVLVLSGRHGRPAASALTGYCAGLRLRP